jgi:predicted phosphodiesterase
MPRLDHVHRPLSRRVFLKGSALILGGLAAGPRLKAGEEEASPVLRVGLVTDVHYADKDTGGSRYYRDSLQKLEEVINKFNAEPPDFAVHIGDLIDGVPTPEANLQNLKTVQNVLDGLECNHYYVLGNHCLDGLTKDEYLSHSAMESAHYGFTEGGFRFAVLDSCYRSDGEPYARGNFHWTDANIPEPQLRWLEAELAMSDDPVIVLAHQRLDDPGNHGVRNARQVRAVLERAGNVAAVFQGHDHRGDFQEINGIPYCTMKALVEGPAPESNAYSMLQIYGDGSMRVEGFRRQPGREVANATSSG